LSLPIESPSSRYAERRVFWLWFAAALGLAFWLRWDQFLDQILIDDEWHAVHQLIASTPSRFMLSFGHADYSIPLTLWYWLQAQWSGLSELGMRMPMLVAGMATVLILPLMLRGALDDRVVLAVAFFLAASPMLIAFSRMARPYAITLTCALLAYACLLRALPVRRGQSMRWPLALGYVLLATLALWMHPITGPYLIAPLLALWWSWLRQRETAPSFNSLTAVTAVTAIAMAVAVLPPLLGDPGALAGKSGVDLPHLATFAGVWYAWLGTGSTFVVVLSLLLAAAGAPQVWRASPWFRWSVLGLALTLAAILVTRPAWIFNPLTFGRYMLPALPVLLVAVAAGLFRLVDLLKLPANARGWTVSLAPILLLAWLPTSPLLEALRRPNTNTLHLNLQADYRKQANPIVPYLAKFPVSSFWAQSAAARQGALTIAVAPFRFESFDWPAPVWEAVSRQRVIPAYLSGTCEPSLPGNIPPHDARFRFRNAVQLAEAESLARAHVTHLAFFRGARSSLTDPDRAYLPQCEAWMRKQYGAPDFEDASLVVWNIAARAAQ
jgi:hypothetical protein